MPHSQDIGLEQLTKYFHLPINAVAKELGVCATVLKKICRKNGIPRHVLPLDKMIGSLQAISPKSPEDEERIKQEIAALINKRRYLITNPNSLVKIKKTHTTTTSTSKGPKRKVAVKQEVPSDGTSEENELSPAFLDADVLDWDGLTSWQGPPFTDADLAAVPYDSPLGRALLMRPFPLDQLPRLLSTTQPHYASSLPHLHMAMPHGGPGSFSPFSLHTTGLRLSAFSAKLPDIGVAEPVPGTLATADPTAAPAVAAKLDILEPNVLHPSVNPLPLNAQYGIHPIIQTMVGHEWRDALPSWYSDEYAHSSRALLGLPAADFGAIAVPTPAPSATTGPRQGQPLPHPHSGQPYQHPRGDAGGVTAALSDESSHQSYLITGPEEGGAVALDGAADPSIFDHLL